ncbi:MAG: hypothetical protein P8H31_03270 [Porticoccaceae bacterium]|nr:hypothetical protein [Porticoccaceae bacterium]
MKSGMDRGIRVGLVLMGLIALLGGFGFVFAPTQMEADFSIVASRVDGLGTIRADLGGMFLMAACFMFYGSRPGMSAWLVVPIVLLLTVLFGRTVHILIDGISQPAIRSTVVEIVALVFLEFSRRKLAANTHQV